MQKLTIVGTELNKELIEHTLGCLSNTFTHTKKNAIAYSFLTRFLGADSEHTLKQHFLEAMPSSAKKECTCTKCNFEINELGFCSNGACVYNQWKQGTIFRDITNRVAISGQEDKKRVFLDAHIQSDDGCVVGTFDAAPYFASLSDTRLIKYIAEIEAEGYCNGSDSDEMALYLSDYHGSDPLFTAPSRVFEHNATLPKGTEACGFSCGLVDEGDNLLFWVEINRPHLYSEIKAIILAED